MKNKKLFLLSAFLMAYSFVFSQDYAFKVLANKGSNEVKSGDTWQPLKTGASLKPTDEVKLSENAYLGLVHSTGRPIELKQAGNYKVSVLEEKVGAGSSVLNKYTDFILSSNSAEAKKNRLSATGAVHRATDMSAIHLELPEREHPDVFNNKIIINWNGEDVAGPYIVTLRNMFDDVLAKIETPETNTEVDISDPKLSSENAILVEVCSKADPKLASKQYLIKKIDQEAREKVSASLNEVMTQVQDTTAINKLVLAGFYEENNLYIDAIAEYEEAIKLAPDVPFYQEAYDEFLLRHGMKK